jgi:hypothetical protein
LPFLFGRRPATSDLGLFGQLSQLVQFDPTSAALAAEVAPRVIAWVNGLDDLGWLEVAENDWCVRGASRTALAPFLVEIGRVYAPFLLANAAALASGKDQVECRIDGRPWVQPPFPYQLKCLRWLREQYGALASAERGFVDAVLAGTGCEALFADR